MAVEDIGAHRWVDAPDRYRDRLRLASSIGEHSGARDGARHCGQRDVQHYYGEPEGLARRIKVPLKRRARAASWMSINCRQSSEQASAKPTPIHLWPSFTAKVVQQFDNSGFEASTKRAAGYLYRRTIRKLLPTIAEVKYSGIPISRERATPNFRTAWCLVISPAELPECDILELDGEGAESLILRNMTIRPRVIAVETHGVYGAPTSW
jgi:hypothetical protein